MRKEKQTKVKNRSVMLRAGKLFLITGISLMLSIGAFAQSDLTDPDLSTPIDGGVSLLVAAGVAYGVKEWRNSRKNQKESTNEIL